MTHNDTRISNARLAEMLAGLEGLPRGPWLHSRPAHLPRDVASYQIGAPDRGVAGQMTAPVAAHLKRCDPDTIRAMILELQALRSTPVEAEPAVWRWTYSIEEGGRMMGPFYGERAPDLSDWPNAVVTHLYAHPLPNPSPSDGEVSEADIEAAAKNIYDEGPSIGGDCECGWAEQTAQYKQKARMVARAALQSNRGQP